MLNKGDFLQNRYEIESCIGSGGMADVYKARDHKLNRLVAVKVLKAEYRNDTAFLTRFRQEASAAASLSHANIVSVFDVGEDQDVSFIVMELVDGMDLKKYIEMRKRLSREEATSIALQVAAGLEAAHNNGVIHRDVKPLNILISKKDGKAKIADFGIARAAVSDTITQKSAMGSVHYSAPEQTRGGYCDAKTDIYALGVTMFEMVTGRLPFDGDTTVAVAMHHQQDEVPSPGQFVDGLWKSTENIILKCMQKNPDLRYANMGELIRDLKESLVNPNGDFVKIRDLSEKTPTTLFTKDVVAKIRSERMPVYDPNLNIGAAGLAGSMTETGSSSRTVSPGGESYYKSSDYPGSTGQTGLNDPEPLEDEGGDEEEPSQTVPAEQKIKRSDSPGRKGTGKKRKNDLEQDEDGRSMSERAERIITFISIIAAVFIVLLILFFLGRAIGLFGGRRTKTSGNDGNGGTVLTTSAHGEELSGRISVPDLRGKTEEEAQRALLEQNLGYKFQGEVASSIYEKGRIASQSVDAGSVVDRGTTIGYYISTGSADMILVPELGLSERQDAERRLRELGLSVVVDNSRYSSSVEEGKVITTNPGAGSSVRAGDSVTIYISQGPETQSVKVPKLTGHYVEDAVTALNNLGIYAYLTEIVSEEAEKGLVMAQDIPEGSMIPSGSAVTLTVSAGSANHQTAQYEYDGSVWECRVQLQAPEIYNGEPVRIDLEQGDYGYTVFEGYTTFPFMLMAQGLSGVGSGTVYVYILDPYTWEETSTTVYNVSFSEVTY